MPVLFSGQGEKLLERNKCPGLNMRQYGMSYISTTYNTLVIKLPANVCTARYPLQLSRLEQCEGNFLLKETQILDCLTFPNYTAGSNGAMWVKFLLKETTTNSIIWGSNQVLLDKRPMPNHCYYCWPTLTLSIIIV